MNTHHNAGFTAAQNSGHNQSLFVSGRTTDSKLKRNREKESLTEDLQVRPLELGNLLQRVTGFYAKTLRKDWAGLEYLKTRKLHDSAMLDYFEVGYSNGSLPSVLPKAGEIIDSLKALCVLNAKGQEQLRGCITVPLFDSAGVVCGLYGRRITNDEPCHVYSPRPQRGLWNRAAAKAYQTLFICEEILDGMALWQAGFKNVIAIYGTNDWTLDHEQFLQHNSITEVFLCFDKKDAGRTATQHLKKTFTGPVKALHVLSWPEGVEGVSDFFLKRGPKDFEALLQALQAQPAPASEHAAKAGQEQITVTPDGFTVAYGPRRYDIRAIEKPSAARLKATIRAIGEQGRFVIDTVDFYVSRSRRSFLSEAARLFRETADVVELDLNRIIQQLESYVEKRLGEAAPTVTLSISEADRAEGLKLGRDPDLTAEIVRDMERLGMIGEAVNKLIGYLVMTSRKLADPLALLVLSGSGAGKSHLQDTVLSLCPDEDLIKLTSLTDRALFYKGEDSLRHKVLAVEELAGAAGAGYAIRNLISARKLVIESTVKNPLTGKLETQVNTVHGPTAVFQTTTNPRTDAETRSRFVLVSVDESPDQTRAILQVQRQSHTLEGWRQRRNREAILRRHHAFQRLLKPLVVVNPFEPLLSYPDEQLLVRRDHPKYLHLILAVTFLHQCQRPVKHDMHLGDYIETTLQDIGIAHDIAHQLFGHSLDDLSQPSRELLALISDYGAKKGAGSNGTGNVASCPANGATFNRRELREAFKWSDTRLRTHLEELVELEYVVPVSGRFGQTYQYRLFYTPNQEPGRLLAGLKSVEQLRQEANLAGILPNLAPTSQVPKREVQKVESPCQHGRLQQPPANLAPFSEEHISASCKNGSNGGAHNHNRRS